MDEDASSNIYDDLPDFRYDKTLDELTAAIAKLEAENRKIASEKVQLINRNKALENDNKQLKTHFSSLLKTAKLEIGRKDRAIDELRERLNQTAPQKKRFGVKRRESVMPSPRKITKVSPRKIHGGRPQKRVEEILTRKKDCKSMLKPKDDAPNRNDKVPSRIEQPGHGGRLGSVKDMKPSKVSTNTDKPLSNGVGADPSEKMADPVLPAIECPTLFSSRMYKRLYGTDRSPAVVGVSEPSDRDQTAVAGGHSKPRKLLRNDRRPSLKSSKRPPPSNPRNRVCSKDAKTNVRKYLQEESFSSSSNSSRSNSPVMLERTAVASKVVNVKKCNDASDEKVAGTELTLEVDKRTETASVGSEVPLSQLPSVDIRTHKTVPEQSELPVSQVPSGKVLHHHESSSGNSGKPDSKLPSFDFRKPDLKESGAPVAPPSSAVFRRLPPEKREVPDELRRSCTSSNTSDVPVYQPKPADLHRLPPEKPKLPLSQSPPPPSLVDLSKRPPEKPEIPVLLPDALHKPCGPPQAKSEAPTRQPLPVVVQEQFVPVTIQKSIDRTKDISQPPTIEQSKAKSLTASLSLLTAGKTRQQTIAAIRPLQTQAPATPVPGEKLGESKSGPISTPSASQTTETPPSEKPNRFVPRLPGSVRGRGGKRVVVPPVQHMWRFPSPNVGSKNNNDVKVSREISVVKTVSVTSELTVRVDDMKQDELNTQLLFGSPVKWADDSLDSPKPENPVNSCNLYSIFGSSCHDLSNSPDPYLSVPPAAYEESCWTTQISDKFPKEPPAGKTDTQKKESSEPLVEMRLTEKAPDIPITTNPSGPAPSSVIKKHVSIFSPLNDSKHSHTSRLLDEPSRSNTGICFPFPRYEDSVLGQFDDTVQFISALAKVDTQISPLSTPVKSGCSSDEIEQNPISFQQVFEKSSLEEAQKDTNLVDVERIAEETPDRSAPRESSNDNLSGTRPSGVSEQSNEKCDTGPEKPVLETLTPHTQTAIQPPAITVTPPKTESSQRLIYRPNFASSAILSVKSWFPDAPVKMVVPRKTPRIVSNANRSASPKILDVSSGARVAINDAFIIEQEERVRRWEQYDNAGRIGSSSPVKSPTRKRIESPGKISPSKRSPKKPAFPSKMSRPSELSKRGVEQTKCPAADTLISCEPVHSKESSVNQPVPGSSGTNAIEVDAVISRQTTTEPVQSLAGTTRKLLTMIRNLMVEPKHFELGSDSSPVGTGKLAAPTSMGSSFVSQVDVEAVVHSIPNDRSDIGTPSSTLEPAVAPSLVLDAVQKNAVTSTVQSKRKSAKITAKKQARPKNQSEPAVSPQSPTPCTPPLLSDKSVPQHAGPAQGSKETVQVASSDEPSSSNVSLTGTSKPLFDCGKPAGTNEEEKQVQSIPNLVDPAPVPAGSPNCSPASTSIDHVGQHKPKVRRPPSKHSALLPAHRPSTPRNQSVAVTLKSSSSPSLNPWLGSKPSVRSTKMSNFKRSSALKRNAGNGAGKLEGPITSCVHQGTPASSERTCSSPQLTPTPRVSPKITLQSDSENVAGGSATRTPDVVQRKEGECYHCTVEGAESGCPAGSTSGKKRDSDEWRLIELDNPPKQDSLLQKFTLSAQPGAIDAVPNPRPEASVAGKPDVLREESQGSAKHLMVSKVFPKTSLRTIMLDAPLKMLTPTKRKRNSGEFVGSPTSNEIRVESNTDRPPQQKRPRVENDEPDKIIESHNSGSGRSGPGGSKACEESSLKSTVAGCDESPARRRSKSQVPNQMSPSRSPTKAVSSNASEISFKKSKHCESLAPHRTRSRSTHQRTPECSPARTESSTTSEKSSRKSRRDVSPMPRRTRSQSTHQKSREYSPAKTESSTRLDKSSRKSRRDESPLNHQRRGRSAHRGSLKSSPARSKSRNPCEKSSRKSGRDESPASRQRRSRSAHNRSPELSPVTSRARNLSDNCIEGKGSNSRTRKRSESQGTHPRSPEGSPAKKSGALEPSDERCEAIKSSKKSKRHESPARQRSRSRSAYHRSPERPSSRASVASKSSSERFNSHKDKYSRRSRRSEHSESPTVCRVESRSGRHGGSPARQQRHSPSPHQKSPEPSPARASGSLERAPKSSKARDGSPNLHTRKLNRSKSSDGRCKAGSTKPTHGSFVVIEAQIPTPVKHSSMDHSRIFTRKTHQEDGRKSPKQFPTRESRRMTLITPSDTCSDRGVTSKAKKPGSAEHEGSPKVLQTRSDHQNSSGQSPSGPSAATKLGETIVTNSESKSLKSTDGSFQVTSCAPTPLKPASSSRTENPSKPRSIPQETIVRRSGARKFGASTFS